MHRIYWLPLFVLSSCTDTDDEITGPSGTYTLSWQVGAGRTCATELVSDVVVTAIDPITKNTAVGTAPCTAGRLELPTNIGTHEIAIEAMGTYGDVASRRLLEAAIPAEGSRTNLPPVILDPQPPMAWVTANIRTKSYCDLYPTAALMLSVTSSGSTREHSRIDLCYSRFLVVENVPYGELTVRAKLVDNNAVFKMTPAVTVAPARGSTIIDLDFQ